MLQLNRTDIEVLDALSDGKRNTPANLAIILDKDRAYLNTRFQTLRDYQLVERIGPSERSGLYEITPKGKFVVDHQDEFFDDDVDFGAFVRENFE